jgi:hypothetical protein
LGRRGEEGVYIYTVKKCVNKGYIIGEGDDILYVRGEEKIAWQGRNADEFCISAYIQADISCSNG